MKITIVRDGDKVEVTRSDVPGLVITLAADTVFKTFHGEPCGESFAMRPHFGTSDPSDLRLEDYENLMRDEDDYFHPKYEEEGVGIVKGGEVEVVAHVATDWPAKTKLSPGDRVRIIQVPPQLGRVCVEVLSGDLAGQKTLLSPNFLRKRKADPIRNPVLQMQM